VHQLPIFHVTSCCFQSSVFQAWIFCHGVLAANTLLLLFSWVLTSANFYQPTSFEYWRVLILPSLRVLSTDECPFFPSYELETFLIPHPLPCIKCRERPNHMSTSLSLLSIFHLQGTVMCEVSMKRDFYTFFLLKNLCVALSSKVIIKTIIFLFLINVSCLQFPNVCP
jgi:hypothetical protein